MYEFAVVDVRKCMSWRVVVMSLVVAMTLSFIRKVSVHFGM